MNKDPNFKVPITSILNIFPHPNPDVHSLVVAKIYDFDVIISNKSGYKVGDRVVYFPVNSILPAKIENFIFPPDSKIKLEKSRVKAVRIQKFVSQGLIVKWEDIKTLLELPNFKNETDMQEILHVVKYYPPATIVSNNAPKQKKPRNKPLENPYFKEYNGCTNIKWEPFAFDENDNVYITEKIHGCVSSETIIETLEHGNLTIKKIVDDKIFCHVKSYDVNTKQICFEKIEKHHFMENSGEWYELELENGQTLIITGNNKIWIENLNCYRMVSDLIGNETLLIDI